MNTVRNMMLAMIVAAAAAAPASAVPYEGAVSTESCLLAYITQFPSWVGKECGTYGL